MPENIRKFKKDSFTVVQNGNSITITCHHLGIELNPYSVVLLARDKNKQITTCEKRFPQNGKKNAVCFEGSNYPIFAFIYDTTRQYASETKGNFDALVTALNVKLTGKFDDNIEFYHQCNKPHFKEKSKAIIELFSQKKNLGTAVAFIEFNFEKYHQTRMPIVEEVYDFPTIVKNKEKKLEFASVALEKLKFYEENKAINGLINYFKGDSEKSIFKEGIKSHKDLLSRITSASDEKFEKIKTQMDNFLNNLEKKYKEYSEYIEIISKFFKNTLDQLDKFKVNKNLQAFIDKKYSDEYKLELTSEINKYNLNLSTILKNPHDQVELTQKLKNEINDFFKKIEKINGEYEAYKYLEDKLKALIDKYGNFIASALTHAHSETETVYKEYQGLVSNIQRYLEDKNPNQENFNKYSDQLDIITPQLQELKQKKIETNKQTIQKYLNDVESTIINPAPLFGFLKALFPHEELKNGLAEIKNILISQSKFDEEKLAELNPEVIRRPLNHWKNKYQKLSDWLSKKSNNIEGLYSDIDKSFELITKNIIQHTKKLKQKKIFSFNFFTNWLFRKYTKEKIKFETELANALKKANDCIKCFADDHEPITIDNLNSLNQLIKKLKTESKNKIFKAYRGYKFSIWKKTKPVITSEAIAKDAMALVSNLEKLQENVVGLVNEESNQSQQGLQQVAHM